MNKEKTITHQFLFYWLIKKKYEKQNKHFWGVFKQLNVYSVALLWKKELVVNFCIQFNLYGLVAVETNELYCNMYIFCTLPLRTGGWTAEGPYHHCPGPGRAGWSCHPLRYWVLRQRAQTTVEGYPTTQRKGKAASVMFNYRYYMHQWNIVCMSCYFHNGQNFQFLSETF